MADTGAAWFAAIAAIFSAGAATVSSVQASRQAGIAARKLKFDLFAKRLEAWEAINAAIEGRREVISEMRSNGPEERDGGDARRRFWHHRLQMKFLFPGEVDECLDRIDTALLSLAVCAVGKEHPAEPGPERAASVNAQYAGFLEQTVDIFRLRGELKNRVAPYMEQFDRPKPKGWIRWAWDWIWGRT